MEPKKQKKIVFVNQCNCLVDVDVLEKAMLWYSGGNLKSPRKIYMHAKYPCVSIFDKKIHVHRLIGLYLWRDIVVSGMVVHHKDHDKLNASIDNLDIISNTVHASHHNKGRVLSKEHKEKISKANSKRKGMKMKRKYNIPVRELNHYLSLGYSINKIATIYGCDWSVIKHRIHENPDLLGGDCE